MQAKSRYQSMLPKGDCVIDLNNFMISDSYDIEFVQRYDDMLHETLTEIFCERSLTGDQKMKLLRRSFAVNSDQDSVTKLILERKPALSEIFPEGIKLSLLGIAVLKCYQKSAELLVRSGADVNDRYEKKTTIFQQLFRMHPSPWNNRFIALAMEHGADFRVRDSLGKTALHHAVENSRVQVIELLLEKGADVNAVDVKGRTPLLRAADSSDADKLVPLLMKHGADATVRDMEGMNALHHLALAPVEHVKLARVLIEKGVSLDDRQNDRGMYQPLHAAVYYQKNELVKLFLDHGADVNARTGLNYSPLHHAANNSYNSYKGDPAVLKTLLQRGADVDLKTDNGRTALHFACSDINNTQEHVKILLSVDADIFDQDLYGRTPFDLIFMKSLHNPMVTLMLRALALKKTCLQPSIKLKVERTIKRYRDLWTYYQDCLKEIRKTKSARFVESCTLFDLLTNYHCQIAPLMRNPEFESGFERYDLTVFSRYAEWIREAFNRVKGHYLSIVEQEDVINEAVYCILPWMVVRRVARVTAKCEECEMKRVVHASRNCSDKSS